MPSQKSGRLSPIKWIAGVLVLLLVIVGAIAIGAFLHPGPTPQSPPAAMLPLLHVVLVVIGLVLLFLGALGWTLVMLTHNWTFDFTRPFFRGYGGKLWAANLMVGMLFQGGLAIMTAPLLMRLLTGVLPDNLLMPVSFFAPFIALQLFFVWFSIWGRLEPMVIRRRMRAMGYDDAGLAGAIPIGISDPGKSSLKKMTLVEEDLGMLWVTPQTLSYRGDSDWFDITRSQLLEIQRKADAGSVSSYFGAAHVILRFLQPDGSERRVRLHPEQGWTQTAKAKIQDALAERIEGWRGDASAGPQEVE